MDGHEVHDWPCSSESGVARTHQRTGACLHQLFIWGGRTESTLLWRNTALPINSVRPLVLHRPSPLRLSWLQLILMCLVIVHMCVYPSPTKSINEHLTHESCAVLFILQPEGSPAHCFWCLLFLDVDLMYCTLQMNMYYSTSRTFYCGLGKQFSIFQYLSTLNQCWVNFLVSKCLYSQANWMFQGMFSCFQCQN